MASSSLNVSGLSVASRALARQAACDHRINAIKSVRKLQIVNSSSEKQTKNAIATSVAVSSLVAFPGLASAVEVEDITAAFSQVQSFADDVTSKATESYELVKSVVDQVVTTSKPFVDAVTPVVQQAAQKAIEVATPVAADVANKAQQALSDAGVDTSPAFEAAKTAVSLGSSVSSSTSAALETASPYAQSSLEILLAQDPAILALGAGSLVLLYLLAPTLAASVAYSARGYAGDLTPAQTLDLLSLQQYTLVDVRTEKEKVKSGIPALPKSAQNKRIFVPVEDLSPKVRSLVRDPRGVEAELTAIKISALKKLNKGSLVAILDSNGSTSKQVARYLTKLGFSNVFVVNDGTDGSNGWIQSQLAVASYRSPEILSPSRVVSGTIFSPRSTPPAARPTKGFLLAGKDD